MYKEEQDPLLSLDFTCEHLSDLILELSRFESGTVSVALRESWLINARLLIEFLGLHGRSGNNYDFKSQDVGYLKVQNSSNSEFWRNLHQVASKFVAHMSKARSQKDEWSNIELSYESIRTYTWQLLLEYGQFIAHLEANEDGTSKVRWLSLNRAVETLCRTPQTCCENAW